MNKRLYNKNIQDVVVILALIMLNAVLFNNVYAADTNTTDDAYDTALVTALNNANKGPSCEEYNNNLVKVITGTGQPSYTDEDYLNDLAKAVNGSAGNSIVGNNTVLTDENVFFADAHGLRVIRHKEISKVIKSAKMNASIIASPALLEFARINGIATNGRVLSRESVKQVSVYLMQFLNENKTPKVLAFVRDSSANIETSLASMITDENELKSFINQHQFELAFPGMLIDFTNVL